MLYLYLLSRPSNLQFIQWLQGLLVPMAGVWMSVCCPGAGYTTHDGHRSHLVQQLTVWTSVLASRHILVRPFSGQS